MNCKLAFAGGLRLSWRCLKVLCENGAAPELVFGYDESLAHRSGYCDLGDLCDQYGLEYHRIRDINSDRVVRELQRHRIDLFLVWNWSQLVKPQVLGIPKVGCLGMHPTKLPAGRGRAPIPWSIIKGIRDSAISIFFLAPGVDDGDIVYQHPFEIFDDDDATSLYRRLEDIHEEAVKQFCKLLSKDKLPRIPQDRSRATYWPRRRPADGVIDWRKPAGEQVRWIRALTDPYPGAFTFLDGKKVLFWTVETGSGQGGAGEILGPANGRGVRIGTGDGAINVLIAQIEDQPRRPAGEFLSDGQWRTGQVFGGQGS